MQAKGGGSRMGYKQEGRRTGRRSEIYSRHVHLRKRTSPPYLCFLRRRDTALPPGNATADNAWGMIPGRSIDQSYAAVLAPSVTGKNTAAGAKLSAHSTRSGSYVPPYLVPGMSEICVALSGFKDFAWIGIHVGISDSESPWTSGVPRSRSRLFAPLLAPTFTTGPMV